MEGIHNWQDALWAIPNFFGKGWDVFFGWLALATALIGFLKQILHAPFDALLVGRVMVYASLLMVWAAQFNSGWLKLALGLYVVGIFFSTMLIVTNWCHRPDKSLTMHRALLRWFHGAIIVPSRSRDTQPKAFHE